LVVRKLITPGFNPDIVAYTGLSVCLDAMSKNDLVLARVCTQTVFDDYDVIATVFSETVFQDREVHFGEPFEEFI
jgi:hypothetical protein